MKEVEPVTPDFAIEEMIADLQPAIEEINMALGAGKRIIDAYGYEDIQKHYIIQKFRYAGWTVKLEYWNLGGWRFHFSDKDFKKNKIDCFFRSLDILSG